MKRIIAFVFILTCFWILSSEGRAQQRRNQNPARQKGSTIQIEFNRRIKDFWDSVLTKCGDLYFTIDASDRWNTLYEFRGVSFKAVVPPLSEVNRMNGYEISGSNWLVYKAYRTVQNNGTKSEWKDRAGPGLSVVLSKKNGNWTSFMNYNFRLRKIECADIPGIPVNDVFMSPSKKLAIVNQNLRLHASSSKNSIEVPQVNSADPDSDFNKPTSIVLSLPTDRDFYLGDDKITPDKIAQKIWDLTCNNNQYQFQIYIKASKYLPFGTIAKVMNAARDAGFEEFNLVLNDSSKGALLTTIKVQIVDPRKSQQSQVLPCKRKHIQSPPPPPPPPAPPGAVAAKRKEISTLSIIDVKAGVEMDQVVEMKKVEVRLDYDQDPNIIINYQAESDVTKLTMIEMHDVLRNLFEQHAIDLFIKVPAYQTYGDIITVINQVKHAGASAIRLLINAR